MNLNSEGITKGRKRSRSPAAFDDNPTKRDASSSQIPFTDDAHKSLPLLISGDSTASIKSEATKKVSGSAGCLSFKNPKYKESGFALKTKGWKNLKQIMALQKSQSSSEVLYASIDAPPSCKPVKKYSDISGLPARYSDPVTKLRYSNCDEYRIIQNLSSDTVTGLLALRRATY